MRSREQQAALQPSTDTVLDLLRDSRRRTLIAVLCEHDRPLTVTDLRNEIAVREWDAPVTDVPGAEMRHIVASLHHTHVPKLRAAGLVEYDRDRRTVVPTDRLDRLESTISDLLSEDLVSEESSSR